MSSFNSPLAQHLTRAAAAADGQPGARRSVLSSSSAASNVYNMDTAPKPAAAANPSPTGAPAGAGSPSTGAIAALQQLADRQRQRAVSAAAAALQSPAAVRPSPATAPRSGSRLAFGSTPLGASRLQTPVERSTPPGSSSGATQPQAGATGPPRTSFKQQAQELQLQRQQQTPAGPAGLASGSKRQAPPLAQQQAQQQQQQGLPPPTSSLEEALGQLQLKAGLEAGAAAAAAAPGLKMRSRGLLTPVGTPRVAAAAESSHAPSAWQGTALIPNVQGQPPAASEEGQQLWSPMLPAPGLALAAQGAGALRTLRRAPPSAGEAGSCTATEGGGQAAPGPLAAAGAAPTPAGAAAGPTTPHRSYGGLADGPAEVRRQLQAIAPELTLTQPPAGRPAAGAPPAAAAAQRPAGVADRAAAQGLLARMHQLQAEAAALLQEQAAGARCSGAAAAFRGLAALGPAASEGSSSGGTPAERQKAAAAAAAAPQRGPSPAVAERLARLRKLQAQGAALAAGVA